MNERKRSMEHGFFKKIPTIMGKTHFFASKTYAAFFVSVCAAGFGGSYTSSFAASPPPESAVKNSLSFWLMLFRQEERLLYLVFFEFY